MTPNASIERAWVLTVGLLVAACSAVAEPSTVRSPLTSATEGMMTLQYRVARDAFAPSRFVAVVGDGITMGFSLVWNLPPPAGEEEKAARDEERERFHRLVEMLEARQINGVEFECTGKLDHFVLYATSVPRLTESGRRQIEKESR